ncbi:MAG: carboxylate-amine ligase [Thermodesulfobacteriota bacterium]
MGVTSRWPGLFCSFGLELEYMLVDRHSLDVAPLADRLLALGAGKTANEVERGIMAWSNELALHVIEIKNSKPVPDLAAMVDQFQAQVTEIAAIAGQLGATLLPTAMHPWMDPLAETRLWPHGNHEIYHAYDRIFNCQGHGWSNLQSAHLNLGFASDEEFGRLHGAIRLLLPIMPALTASSPLAEGRPTGMLDTRLHHYRHNQRAVPILTGRVVPEQVYSQSEYEQRIYQPIATAIVPHDPEGILEPVWLNSRGAIARFDRNAIEIRILDIQECPLADVSIAILISAALQGLVEERWSPWKTQRDMAVEPLAELFEAMLVSGEETMIADAGYLALFGITGRSPLRAADLWRELADRCQPTLAACGPAIEQTVRTVLAQGPLARRILRALGPAPGPDRLRKTYEQLTECLLNGNLFTAGA